MASFCFRLRLSHTLHFIFFSFRAPRLCATPKGGRHEKQDEGFKCDEEGSK